MWGRRLAPRHSVCATAGRVAGFPTRFAIESGIELALETCEGWGNELQIAEALDAAASRVAATFTGSAARQIIEGPEQGPPHRFYRVQVRK